MTPRQRVGTSMILSGLLVGIPNYLWLLGIMNRASDDLFGARWIYEGVVIFFGVMIGWMQ